MRNLARILSVSLLALTGTAIVSAQEYKTGIPWKEPAVVTPGKTAADPPSDAVVLFGKADDIQNWENGERWSTEGDVLVAGKGYITSKETFGDCQLHVEWSAPTPPKGEGQGRGNSGIFLMGIYEIQVLDSYDNPTYFDGQAGSVYKQTPPAVNATRPPGEWNTYDIFWTAPLFKESGELLTPAFVSVVHNGVLLLNHFQVKGDTPFDRAPEYKAHGPRGPIAIQDHNNPVRFRNIWARDFTPAQVETQE